MSTLHVIFGDSAAGTLKQAVRGRDDRVVSFGDDLSWGPVGSVAERMEFLDSACPIPGGWDWLSDAHEAFWDEAGQAADDRLIWVSSNCAQEMSAYLAYLERFSNQRAAVVRPDLHLPPHPKYGPLLGTGTANVEQLADVLENAERRPLAEDHSLFNRWAELRSEKALLRVMSGTNLVSAPVDTYDRLLLDAATTEWQRGVLVVGNALGASFDEQVRVGSDFLFSRLAALVRSGALEAQGDVLGWEDDGRRAPSMVRKHS